MSGRKARNASVAVLSVGVVERQALASGQSPPENGAERSFLINLILIKQLEKSFKGMDFNLRESCSKALENI